MTPNDIAAAAERVGLNQSENRQSFPDDYMILALAYIAEKRERDLTFRVNEMASIERAVMDPPDKPEGWPDWVYEARRAVRMMRGGKPSWLDELFVGLGWQGGTAHQALNAVRRMVEAEKEREAKLAMQAEKDTAEKLPTPKGDKERAGGKDRQPE